jgi:hypothetical protein
VALARDLTGAAQRLSLLFLRAEASSPSGLLSSTEPLDDKASAPKTSKAKTTKLTMNIIKDLPVSVHKAIKATD